MAIVSPDPDGSLREPPFQKGFITITASTDGGKLRKSDARTWGLAQGRASALASLRSQTPERPEPASACCATANGYGHNGWHGWRSVSAAEPEFATRALNALRSLEAAGRFNDATRARSDAATCTVSPSRSRSRDMSGGSSTPRLVFIASGATDPDLDESSPWSGSRRGRARAGARGRCEIRACVRNARGGENTLG